MATVQELKSVVAETLEHRGVLGQLRARIRAEVFSALDDQSESHPPLTNENLLINELIREYMDFNQYKYSTSVFLAETGQPTEPLDREFLSRELGIAQDQRTAAVPILYSLVSDFLSRKAQSNHRVLSSLASGNEDRQLFQSDSDLSADGFIAVRGRGK